MWCFKKLSKKPGDFSFVNNRTIRFSLEHDYHTCLPLIQQLGLESSEHFNDGERSSLDEERPNVWDTPPGEEWRKIQNKACPFHSEQTYHRNMKIMSYIAKHGWEKFLENKKLISSFSES